MSKLYRSFNYTDAIGQVRNSIRFDVMIGDDLEADALDCEMDENTQGVQFIANVSINNREVEEFGSFRFSTISGIGTAVLVSSQTFVIPKWRRSPASQKFRLLKADVARSLGCQLLIATADASDVPAYKNLLKSGYNVSHVFVNKQTGHPVAFGTKAL